jgi:hypothetical protein
MCQLLRVLALDQILVFESASVVANMPPTLRVRETSGVRVDVINDSSIEFAISSRTACASSQFSRILSMFRSKVFIVSVNVETRLSARASQRSRQNSLRGSIFRQEPKADGNLRAVEEPAGEGDHAVYEVGLDEGAADVAFAGLVGGHAAIGEDEAGHAVGREVVDEVLHPGEVGVAPGRTGSSKEE